MNDIKEGNLVMVVKSMQCCSWDKSIGMIFITKAVEIRGLCHCRNCGEIDVVPVLRALRPDGAWSAVSRLKKIDPPATGDSLPVRIESPITNKEAV